MPAKLLGIMRLWALLYSLVPARQKNKGVRLALLDVYGAVHPGVELAEEVIRAFLAESE